MSRVRQTKQPQLRNKCNAYDCPQRLPQAYLLALARVLSQTIGHQWRHLTITVTITVNPGGADQSWPVANKSGNHAISTTPYRLMLALLMQIGQPRGSNKAKRSKHLGNPQYSVLVTTMCPDRDSVWDGDLCGTKEQAYT